MMMNPSIFREYDIRGVAGQDFDPAFARTLGQAYGTLAREEVRLRRALRHAGERSWLGSKAEAHL